MKDGHVYKTPPELRARMKAKRAAIKASGGTEYAALLTKERADRKRWCEKNRWQAKIQRHRNKKQLSLNLVATPEPTRRVKRNLVYSARERARLKGLECSIKVDDIYWPTHCPVLGLELDYSPVGSRRSDNASNPSLDRWDNTKGYVRGNVIVISMRANSLKSNATYDELIAVAEYARRGVPWVRAA